MCGLKGEEGGREAELAPDWRVQPCSPLVTLCLNINPMYCFENQFILFFQISLSQILPAGAVPHILCPKTYPNANEKEFDDQHKLAGIDFTAGLPVPTGGFQGGPASFVMRRSSGPVNFCDIYSLILVQWSGIPPARGFGICRECFCHF